MFATIPDLVDTVSPSVVAILTDDGQGSGVIWEEDGTIVTNAHVFFGISPAAVTEELSAQLQVPTDDGVVVMDVVPDGPADRAGIQPGDVIVSLDDIPIETPEDFVSFLRTREVGDEVTAVVVSRNGRSVTRIELEERPGS